MSIYEQAFVKWLQAERGGSKHLFGIVVEQRAMN